MKCFKNLDNEPLTNFEHRGHDWHNCPCVLLGLLRLAATRFTTSCLLFKISSQITFR